MAFVEAFNTELGKRLLKAMDAQERKAPEKVSTIWVKNLNSIVKKISNKKSFMTGLKPKDANKLGTAKLHKSGKYVEVNVLPQDRLYRYLYQRGDQHGDKKKDGLQILFEVKIPIE